MADQGLKVLSFAFKDMKVDTVQQILDRLDDESPEFRDEMESELTYLCTFGLQDEPRDGVKQSVEMLKFG